jgi:Glycosyltransferase family 87
VSSLSAAAVSPRGQSLGALCARAIAALSLLGLVASSLTVVLIAAERPSFLAPFTRPGFFPAWMVGPLRGLWPGLTANPSRLAWLVSALMALMFGLYLVAFLTASRLRARWTIAAVLATHLIFLLAPPLSYTDVFNYVNYGRMGVVHHLNPYVTLPASGPHADLSFALSNWHHLRSPYGPLFTLLSYALVPLGVKASFWALKLLVCGASLATLGLVWRCARLLRRSPVAAVAFVAFNPIVLVWGLGADHNDALMMLFVVLAVYLALRERPGPSWGGAGGALVTGIFVKASAAVLLPVFLVAGAARRRFVAGALLAAAALALVSVSAFGVHLPDLSTQGRLVTAIGIPNLIGLALGQGGETATLQIIVGALAGLAVLGCAIWAGRRPREWITACGIAMLALVVSLSWAAPWYVLWILPFAALSAGRRLRVATTLLGAYLILAFMPAAVLLAGEVGFHPAATPLGVEHARAIANVFR